MVNYFGTPVDDVRALIPDIEKVQNPNRPDADPEYIFSDSHLNAFLRLNGGSVRRAAADACEALGTSEAIILKVITTEDLATNGAALMGRYLERARQMRQTASADDNNSGDGGFTIVPFFARPAHPEWR